MKDSQKQQLVGVYGVLFSLYEQKEGGSPLWMEVQNVEADQHGLYSVLVGSTTGEGIDPDLFAKQKTLWLGMQVSLLGESEHPRIKLAETPEGLRVERELLLTVAGSNADEAASATEAPSDIPDSQAQQKKETNRLARAHKLLRHYPMP